MAEEISPKIDSTILPLIDSVVSLLSLLSADVKKCEDKVKELEGKLTACKKNVTEMLKSLEEYLKVNDACLQFVEKQASRSESEKVNEYLKDYYEASSRLYQAFATHCIEANSACAGAQKICHRTIESVKERKEKAGTRGRATTVGLATLAMASFAAITFTGGLTIPLAAAAGVAATAGAVGSGVYTQQVVEQYETCANSLQNLGDIFFKMSECAKKCSRDVQDVGDKNNHGGLSQPKLDLLVLKLKDTQKSYKKGELKQMISEMEISC